MGEHDSTVTSSSGSTSSSSSCSIKPPQNHHLYQFDHQLAGAGYRVRSSELRHVAQRLEHLENAMVNNNSAAINTTQLVNDVIHYNPSDLSSWVDSLLSELNPATAGPLPAHLPGPAAWPESEIRPHAVKYPQDEESFTVAAATPRQQQQQLLTVVTGVQEVQEDFSSIRLVHVLMTCAEAIQRGELSLAASLTEELRGLLTRVNTNCGIGKVAGYFIDALSRRLFEPGSGIGIGSVDSAFENEILYHHFYEACPYLKFAHFTANQAILEAFEGHDSVHVIDFSLMQGLQWPALIQALALRPGGPPMLRLTGIGLPSSDGRDSLREVGLKLAELARSVNVRFAFRGVAASRLDQVKPWMLQLGQKEVVAVNSIMQLHRLLGQDLPNHEPPINTVLKWVKTLNPKIVTVVEQEANHNQEEFLDRFTGALYYYSTMFDSLEACSAQPEKALAEIYIQREICNVVCCEGMARVERHEPLVKWRSRLGGAGFRPLHLGSNAFKQASMLLTLFSAEGYCVEENEGCLTLGWHNRPLIAASAWQPLSPPILPPEEDNLL